MTILVMSELVNFSVSGVYVIQTETFKNTSQQLFPEFLASCVCYGLIACC
eukprot:m.52745 g.52745  ORF g.52745 m.52745 type:complete len:50 (-) comp10814_c0_seq1:1484-1633(-)